MLHIAKKNVTTFSNFLLNRMLFDYALSSNVYEYILVTNFELIAV